MDLPTNSTRNEAPMMGLSPGSSALPIDDIHRYLSKSLANIRGWQMLIVVLFILVAYDQCMYIWRKGSIAGPRFKIPFMGPFLQALDPKFEGYEAQWASGTLSCVSVFHKFVVMVSERDLARKVFNSPTYIKPCLVPIADNIMGGNPWVLLDGKPHVDYRKGLNGLFTRKALEIYLPTQEKVWSQYFDKFVAASKENGGKPMPFMGHFREIGCALSCRTFVGEYISDEAIKKIAEDFYCITAALELVNIPLAIYVPYTKAWLGKRAASGVLTEFAKCSAASKIHMASGGTPTCLVDRWILNMIESKNYQEKTAAGKKDAEKPSIMLREFSDFEIAQVLFTFLFASQDASSSSTTYIFQLMAQHPEILDRVRQENLDARSGNKNASLTLEMIESMTYTNAVVKETLRYRPPVIFVPYETKKAFPITPTYTVPKGAMVIPSCYPALHDPEVYPQPDVFDPERWITGNAGEQVKSWMVFGAGPHNCIAQQYVQITMMAMIGKAALEVEWLHHATKRSDEIKVFATLFPMDDCPMVFTKRP